MNFFVFFDSLKSQEQLGSVFWNSALSNGVLGDELELRWERFTNELSEDADFSPRALGRPHAGMRIGRSYAAPRAANSLDSARYRPGSC